MSCWIAVFFVYLIFVTVLTYLKIGAEVCLPFLLTLPPLQVLEEYLQPLLEIENNQEQEPQQKASLYDEGPDLYRKKETLLLFYKQAKKIQDQIYNAHNVGSAKEESELDKERRVQQAQKKSSLD